MRGGKLHKNEPAYKWCRNALRLIGQLNDSYEVKIIHVPGVSIRHIAHITELELSSFFGEWASEKRDC